MSNKSKNNQKKVGQELKKYTKYWYWFIITVSITVSAAYFYLKYATPVFKATASIIIKNDGTKGNSDAAYGFSDASMFGLRSEKIESEISILNSRQLMKEVVKALNLHITYSIDGRFRNIELYDDKPFTVKLLAYDAQKLKKFSSNFVVTYLGEDEFLVMDRQNFKEYRVSVNEALDIGFSKILLTNPKSDGKNLPVNVDFHSIESMAANYGNKVSLIQGENSSNVIRFELTDPVPNRAKNVLDQLILEYNKDAIEDKNLIAENTANFINERLTIINSELDSVETGKVEFKKENRLTDLSSESEIFVQNASEYSKRKQELGTQLELVNTILQFLSSTDSDDLIPANLGIEAAGVNQQISEYNNYILERNRLLNSSTEKNPMVKRINDNLGQVKYNIYQSLKQSRSSLQISLNELRRQSYNVNSKISEIPLQEKENRGIERQQKIKESLYLYLLQKREENTLALAVTEPKAKIVDEAYSNGIPVAPNPRSIFLGAFLLGLLVPFSLIFGFQALDNKVRSKIDLQEFLSKEIPLVAEIPSLGRMKKNFLIQQKDRSVLAESFRILMTNLQVHLKKRFVDKNSKVIMLTSASKGEGKTFTTMNLGITMANSNKRVLLIGADLRNPQMQRYIEKPENYIGLSEYLSEEAQIDGIVRRSNIHANLDMIYSGSIPYNPSELLRCDRLEYLFNEMKSRYDYILVDTAPSMLVADTAIISEFADLTLYLVKAGSTKKESLDFIQDANGTTLKNICCILNCVQFSNLRYGNKYGYGYGEKRKKYSREIKTSTANTVTS
ncbi:GumC family protein [Zunongwangia atlantica]|uniref:non-specific protein-tyrosine kinase n=1 Tax=Zunongwangia atlantica 22II14-10F7 TaxID=1185767 RepID=A0A1Y1SZK4_9FLAO|nr:polysaccharide biosynthesis tyrosine autokinase [Zunongwangia atlantica]ORL44180.1 capsular exopolysaccharide biosynthesis protein [Zunongwangia atlantica 22II14-10F7]